METGSARAVGSRTGKRRETDDSQLNDDDAGRQFVVALARGLNLLKLFTAPDTVYSNAELAQLSGLTKPTVSRLTFTLTRLGYLTCCPHTGRYTVGPAALSLGYWTMSSFYLRQVAKPLMEAASQELNLCCALGYRDAWDAVYLEHTRGSSPLILGMQAGSRVPLATTAIGKALIAALDDGERQRLFADAAREYQNAWPDMRKALERASREIARTGFVISRGEWEPEINAVGAPLRLDGGLPQMAIVLGGISYALEPDGLAERVGPRLLRLAADIRARLAERRAAADLR